MLPLRSPLTPGRLASIRYTNIRIDAVHYCELETIFSQSRARRNAQLDPPAIRLQLLSRTLRETPHLAALVLTLKLPFTTRESRIADIARTVSVLPNLRYVDLPEGFFAANPTSHLVRTELQARCPDIRRTKYAAGTEDSFKSLERGVWQNLEVLELSGLRFEEPTLRFVLHALTSLRDLKLTDMPWVSDGLFMRSTFRPDFPSVRKLSLERMPNISANGLTIQLSDPVSRGALSYLELKNTGVFVADLFKVVAAATHLEELAFAQEVTDGLVSNVLQPLLPLASRSLKILYFEITAIEQPNFPRSLSDDPARSYYHYLSGSLHAGALPELRELYVRDLNFPELLILYPPAPAFAGMFPPYNPAFRTHPLDIYTKGDDDLEWAMASMTPASRASLLPPPTRQVSFVPPRDSVYRGLPALSRPVSAHGASASRGLSNQWGSEARRSVVVGDGAGGFLAVPVPAEAGASRPRSAVASSGGHARGLSVGTAHKKKRSANQIDLWR